MYPATLYPCCKACNNNNIVEYTSGPRDLQPFQPGNFGLRPAQVQLRVTASLQISRHRVVCDMRTTTVKPLPHTVKMGSALVFLFFLLGKQ